MRVSSGTLKGLSIEIPKHGIKPTSDKVRQALINHFRPQLLASSLRVLDLYCGSGAVGIEFLSNGAVYCCFVEQAPLTYLLLKKNLKKLVSSDRYQTLKHAAQTLSPDFLSRYGKFDIIFADPFYKDSEKHFGAIVSLAKKILNPKGTLVLEHASKQDFSSEVAFRQSKKYGDTSLSYFQFSEESLESSCC